MPYLLIDDGFAENPKIAGLSDKAFRLHMSALVYCARNLTDGAISEIGCRFSAAISKIERPNSVVNQLVSAGLWEPVENGWQIHDYLDYNPSRAELEERRRLARERKRRQRTGNNGKSHDPSRGTSRPSHAHQDPTKGSLKRPPLGASPSGSQGVGNSDNKKAEARAAAERAASNWATPDSAAFADVLDDIEREHGVAFAALERDRFLDQALLGSNAA